MTEEYTNRIEVLERKLKEAKRSLCSLEREMRGKYVSRADDDYHAELEAEIEQLKIELGLW